MSELRENRSVDFPFHALVKLLGNISLATAGNKEYDELLENNVIVNLDEISDKITKLHNMVKAEFDEFETQHKSESDETQALIRTITDELKTAIGGMSNTISTKLDSLIGVMQGVATHINSLESSVNSLSNRVSNLENQ